MGEKWKVFKEKMKKYGTFALEYGVPIALGLLSGGIIPAFAPLVSATAKIIKKKSGTPIDIKTIEKYVKNPDILKELKDNKVKEFIESILEVKKDLEEEKQKNSDIEREFIEEWKNEFEDIITKESELTREQIEAFCNLIMEKLNKIDKNTCETKDIAKEIKSDTVKINSKISEIFSFIMHPTLEVEQKKKEIESRESKTREKEIELEERESKVNERELNIKKKELELIEKERKSLNSEVKSISKDIKELLVDAGAPKEYIDKSIAKFESSFKFRAGQITLKVWLPEENKIRFYFDHFPFSIEDFFKNFGLSSINQIQQVDIQKLKYHLSQFFTKETLDREWEVFFETKLKDFFEFYRIYDIKDIRPSNIKNPRDQLYDVELIDLLKLLQEFKDGFTLECQQFWDDISEDIIKKVNKEGAELPDNILETLPYDDIDYDKLIFIDNSKLDFVFNSLKKLFPEVENFLKRIKSELDEINRSTNNWLESVEKKVNSFFDSKHYHYFYYIDIKDINIIDLTQLNMFLNENFIFEQEYDIDLSNYGIDYNIAENFSKLIDISTIQDIMDILIKAENKDFKEKIRQKNEEVFKHLKRHYIDSLVKMDFFKIIEILSDLLVSGATNFFYTD